MLWLKSFHIIFAVTWFAGLFYLPRLFVYHSMLDTAADKAGDERFKVMERKLFRGIMTPGAVLTVGFGAWMLAASGWSAYTSQAWMIVKLVVAAALIGYHAWCGKLVGDFAQGKNRRSHVWYRWFNEAPTVALVAIVILAVVKPW